MEQAVSRTNDHDNTRQELLEREAELALINSVQQALASHLDVQAIYNLVGDKIRDIFDSQVVMISTYDQTTDTIEHRYAIERGEHIYAPGRYPIRGFRTQIVQTRQPVLANKNVPELAAKMGQHTIPGTITPKSWLGVPMIVGDQVTGILSLQNVDHENAFDESDVRLLQTLAASMSVALENARLFDETERLLAETEQRANELHMINGIQEGLAKKLDRGSIYELVGNKLNWFVTPTDLALLTYDADTDILSTAYEVENGTLTCSNPYHVSGRGFFSRLLADHQPVLLNEHVDKALVEYEQVYSSGKPLPKSILFIPITLGENVLGAIVLKDMSKEGAFDEGDIRLMKTVANSMSVALENARLWEQEALYRKALEREFEIGREMQAGFLPETIPQPQGWEIAASMKSAREVTGDFYDVFDLTQGKIGLVIADVCDKGLGAALYMTLFRSLIRAVSTIDFYTSAWYSDEIAPDKRLSQAMSFTNNYIAEAHGRTSMFCTIFFGILDTVSGKLTYINAGHLPPCLLREGKIIDSLTATGPSVGLTPGTSYTIGEVNIDHGDLLFAHTDGLTDTVNPENEFLPLDNIIPLLAVNKGLDSVLDTIQTEIKDYARGVTQVDDITLLAVKRQRK